MLAGSVVLSAGVLVACSSTPGTPQDGAGPAATEAVTPRTWEDELVALAEMFGVADPPVVKPVREITPMESKEVLDACLVERGWTMNDAGSFSRNVCLRLGATRQADPPWRPTLGRTAPGDIQNRSRRCWRQIRMAAGHALCGYHGIRDGAAYSSVDLAVEITSRSRAA